MKDHRDKQSISWVMGRRSLQEALEHHASSILEVFTSQDDWEREFPQLTKLAVPIHIKGRKTLEKLSGSENHQGFVVKVVQQNCLSLHDLLPSLENKERVCLLLLDTIFDPQNLGAIFRIAEGLGVSALVWSKNRGASLSAAVSKASAGASLHVPFVHVSNLANCMRTLQENDFQVFTTEIAEDAYDAFSFNFPDRVALVLGSEGKGVRPLLSKTADGKIYLPLKGRLQSINVSQAATAFLTLWAQAARER